MPDAVTEIRPHAQALHIGVKKRALDEAATKRLIDDVLGAAAQTPHLPIVLDMGNVTFAPSVALGGLVQLTKSLKLDGRRLALVHVNQNVLGSIKVTNLHELLQIQDSLEQVLAAKTK